MLVNRENKNHENFYERTLELEDVLPLLCLMLDSLHDGHSTRLA